MYNVSSSLGSELYESHLLVKTGPYSWCRHPMYLGLALSALGGLMVYRTWTLVFMILSLAGAALKARTEETLLAAEFGKEWEEYASRVPPWLPRAPRAKKEVSHVERTTAG
jgi:protein-S-isoprenylcysteine O-methyltransferase Ste14